MTLAAKHAPERPRAQGKPREGPEKAEEWPREGPRRPRRKKEAQEEPGERPRGKMRDPGGERGQGGMGPRDQWAQ